ncbi:ubiquitin-conjugating enzyme/RWD-like protein [Artemisia annua]|uniref:Ubiquitin-conjugating enzyme/RWD-like protein n=1 Tax=Artemisia annua TaxID=35608 RepID=A0A2U1MBU3_ARTAN|nr:ubiquitin-conjugating enzyme/RWD-like protein [Artemisia annua]
MRSRRANGGTSFHMEIDADMVTRKYDDYAPGSSSAYHVPKKLKLTPHSGPVPVIAPVSGQVVNVLIHEGMQVKKGQTVFLLEPGKFKEEGASSSKQPKESYFSREKIRARAAEKSWKILVRLRNSRRGVFSMEDVSVDHQVDTSCSLAGLDNQEVLKSFKSFKKLDILSDHTGHRFSMFNPSMNHQASVSPEGWADRIEEEWRILEKDLPDTIFVRVFKPKMDLLSAVIVGPKGTPYHDGLYFFDVFIPRSYPECPPLLWYHSGGLDINPNLLPGGGVKLSLPKINGQGIEVDKMWVPGSSNLLKLLVSVKDQFFIPNPLRNNVAYARGDSVRTKQSCLLYNENTLLKSLKTMVYIMNKQPKNFEDFVVGHFHSRVLDILMACQAYMDGMPGGCFGVQMDEEEGNNKVPCTIEFKKDVATYIKQLVAAFERIGASEAKQFLYLSDKLFERIF